ncbi:integrin [Alicycliphilus denitrificans]|uniref:integrin n=1 Tax=Alicycliphilus denitrificans TaxID=179636 RepID=UPI003A804E95
MRPSPRPIRLAALLLGTPLLLSACGGGSSGSNGGNLAAPSGFSVGYNAKSYQFSWSATPGATRYELVEDPDGASGAQSEATVDSTITANSYTHALAGQLLHERINATYRVRACDASGCGAYSAAITPDVSKAVGYFKASNTGRGDGFGISVVLSADGSTMAVGAPGEASKATGANGDQADDTASGAGAVYVFTRQGSGWSQQAYLKASNTRLLTNERGYPYSAQFGARLALSSDGSTLAVGAPREASNTRGVNGDQSNTDTPGAGAVYIFQRSSGAWSQQAYMKSSNTAPVAEYRDDIAAGSYVVNAAMFGDGVALSADGRLLAVGAPGEAGNATGGGAVYVFTQGTSWTQTAYIKPGATGHDGFGFGRAVAFSANGQTLAVSGGNSVSLFGNDGTGWSVQSVLTGSNTEFNDRFGNQVALSADGGTLAVGAPGETSSGKGINAAPGPRSLARAGAAYVFTRSGGAWNEQAFIKASNTDQDDEFSHSIALSADGNTLAVGAASEAGSSTGLTGNQADNAAGGAGAVFLFQRSGNTWSQRSYTKASNTGAEDAFGSSVALSADGKTLAVGARAEDSLATGVQGNQADNTANNSGAVYLY